MALFAWTMYSLIGCGVLLHQYHDRNESLFVALVAGTFWPIEFGALTNEVLINTATKLRN